LLTAGPVFYLFLSLIQRLAGFAGPYGFMAGFIVAIFGAGYLVAYMQRIVASSAMGEDRMPDWPDFGNWQEDIVAPLWQTGALLALCLWPLVLTGFLDTSGRPGVLAFLLTATVFGLAYLPMAMLAVYMGDTITAANPLVVVPAIVRLRSQYWVVCALLGLVVVISQFLQSGMQDWLPVPVILALISGFASLYFLTVEMRLLGLLHWCNREQLGWVKGA
jgi:hypothetical protein